MKLYKKQIDHSRYIIATYYLESATTLADTAWNLAVGQSIGNPSVRNTWETPRLIKEHAACIIGDESSMSNTTKGTVRIAFPLSNLNIREDGISQLMCHLMGGQLDIDIFKKCHLLDIAFPPSYVLSKPKYGIMGIRQFTDVYNKPLLGGIIKPKVGLRPKELLGMVQEMVDGGINFIKEDEIMANPSCCPIEERVPLIMKYLKNKNVIYAVCINSDYPYIMERAKLVHKLGGNAIHVNIWAGLGIYKAIRELDLPLFLFFQKSGDQIITNPRHAFHIDWNVICTLAGMMGVDFIHAGMWGGYSTYDEKVLKKTLAILHSYHVMPSLSCGLHPGLVQAINKRFGMDYMANVGGAIHGHPGGTRKGVMALRQAIDQTFGREYHQAVKKWGEIS